ncbi:acyl carrier protein [Sorangium sp. So ce145]|uniref:acyl carrier protein n=1 Tax=Sorangium sp. So ce145 TaxID=3133285 RepID=UPI003F6193AC
MDEDLQRIIARREDLLERVRRILIEELHVRREPGEIDPDTPLFGTGLGLDSVDAVELVVALEAVFGKRLADGGQGRRWMRTVNTLVDFVIEGPSDKEHAGGDRG